MWFFRLREIIHDKPYPQVYIDNEILDFKVILEMDETFGIVLVGGGCFTFRRNINNLQPEGKM